MTDSSPSEPIHWTGPRPIASCEIWVVELPLGGTLEVFRYPERSGSLAYFRYGLKYGEETITWGFRDDRSAAHKAARDALRDFAQALTDAADRIQTPEVP